MLMMSDGLRAAVNISTAVVSGMGMGHCIKELQSQM